MQSVSVNRKEFIKQLQSIKEKDVSLFGIAVNKAKLTEALRLQNEDSLEITPGIVSWQYKAKMYGGHWSTHSVDNEPCVQFSCDHTSFRFLNRQADIRKQPAVIQFGNNQASGYAVDAKALLKAITMVSPAIAEEETRPVLCAIYFESTGTMLHLTAADGFRLHTVKIKAKIPKGDFLISKDDVQRVTKLLHKATAATIATDQPTVFFSTGSQQVKCQKVIGRFPNYRKLIPDFDNPIVFNSQELWRSIKALPISASSIIRLFVKPNQITLATRDEEEHETKTEFVNVKTKQECKIAINQHYLLDLLRVVGNQSITMRIKGTSYPVKFTWQNGQAVIMPMFVQW